MLKRMGLLQAVILILNIFAFMNLNGVQFPLDNNIVTGSFAEFRTNHFHTGLDLSTLGQIGMPVYAPNDCWVSYIKRDFMGYAKAVFLEDENYIYVFGHLNGYCEKIESRLDTNRFKQVIYPKKNEIKFEKGEIFAYTGRSGTLVPHLHYEIRSKANNPVNPLLFHSIQDSILPEIFGVAIEPADDTTLINGRHDIVYFANTKRQGSIVSDVIKIRGVFRISVKTIDMINSQSAKLAPYRITAQSGMNTFYDIQLDSVSFSLSSISPNYFRGDINVKDNNYLFNLFPDNEKWLSPSNINFLYSDVDTNILINVYDYRGNVSRLNIRIENGLPSVSALPSYVKMKKVDDKICILMSGSYAKERVSSAVQENFTEHIVSNEYKYYILNKVGKIDRGMKIDGLSTKDNIVYIKDTLLCEMGKGIYVKPGSPLQFLYEEKSVEKEGMRFTSPLYKVKLCDRFYTTPIKLIVKGYGGSSLYMYRNGVYVFSGKLEDDDTLRLNQLSSFVIGKDESPPKYSLLSKTKKGNYINYVYKLTDSGSGVDWGYVADSNDVYNEPDHFTGKIKIRISKNREFPVEFKIKDKEGNSKSIFLSKG